MGEMEMAEVAKCPFCKDGGRPGVIDEPGSLFAQVHCTACRACGPRGCGLTRKTRESDAIAAWNAHVESRASNAGGAVALTTNAEYMAGYRDGFGSGYGEALANAAVYVQDHCEDGDEQSEVIRKLKRPDTHPAPASKEPVADGGISFDEWYAGLSPQWQRVIEADSAAKGWTARAALATAQADQWVPVVHGDIPDKGTPVIAWHEDFGAITIDAEYLAPSFPEYTHWMPLPAAPAKPEGV